MRKSQGINAELLRLESPVDAADATGKRHRIEPYLHKPVYLEDPNRDPDFVPLAERIKWYMSEDAIEAAEGKVVQILRRRLSVPSSCHLAPCHPKSS